MDTPEQDPPEQGYPVSELAEAFRGPTPLEYKTLKDDIDLNGQQVPIAFKDKKIVDGRQRKRACIELGITPRYEELPDDIDPARFLMAMHRKYRDLSKNDLALAASQLSAWSRPGGDRKSEDYQLRRDHSAHVHNGLTQQEAARSLGVSPRLVSKASRLLAEDSPAIPELREAVRTGEVNIGAAYEVKDQPPEVQEQALDRFRSGEALTFSDAVKAIVAKETGDSTPQPPGAYRTVVVDPVWAAGNLGREAPPNGQDPTHSAMTVEEIAQMELPLADSGFVFLWTTQEHLPDAFRVLERWGLTYRFTMVWQKGGGVQPTGSCQHDVEFIVAGARGEPRFTSGWSFSSVITAPCADPGAGHSVKPEKFYGPQTCCASSPRAPGRTIAKSGSSSVEPGDGLRGAEGAAFGSQGHGHLGRKPSLEAQGIQCRVDQGGECLAQTGSAQGVNVLIPAAVPGCPRGRLFT